MPRLDRVKQISKVLSLMAEGNKSALTMETLVTLCKRRGFIFPSSEIYGGYAGFFDYGPLGVELKNNIKQAWWQDFVHGRDDIVGIDSSIVMHPRTWEASGHVGGFSDPMTDCRETKKRYRADQLFVAPVHVVETVPDAQPEFVGLVAYFEDAESSDIVKRAKALRDVAGHKGKKLLEDKLADARPFMDFDASELAGILGPDASAPGTLTPAREFKLMFETHVGAVRDASSVAYLRPETAQGIFNNYKNIVDTGRVKLPFGIAQTGKAFRNEITPRNFIFRCREFEQMEIEYFIHPEADWKTLHREWIDTCIDWFVSIGLPREQLHEDVHVPDKLAHYAKACTDITFSFPHGEQELEGIAVRGDFDLKQHQEFSGKNLEYFDEETKARFIPHVIEPSFGVDRAVLAVLTAAHDQDEVPNDKGQPEVRTLLRFKPRIAPYKAAVFPLLKNKPELVEKAKGIHRRLQRRWPVFWDVSGAIGRRYRRQDEIGTPWCITVDFDSLENGTVTIRDRDSTKQERIHESEISGWIAEKLGEV